MRTRPPDIDDRQVIEAAQRGWGEPIVAVEYVPVGGGSHHWRAATAHGAPLWLTLDDLDEKPFLGTSRTEVFETLGRALDVSRTLSHSGLDFVVAPQPTRSGPILFAVGQRYALALYPFLTGTAFAWGTPLPHPHADALLELLVRLHQATPVVAAIAREATPELAARERLEHALRSVHEPWSGGPFGEPARALVARRVEYLTGLLHSFDDLLAEVRQRAHPPVISHGEPHPANLMLNEGRLRLLDWDTVGLALPERDLWWLADASLARYTQATGRCVDAQALRLYRLRWLLDDFIYSVHRLRAPHTRTVDIERTWEFLSRALSEAE
jgi:spectinomycin phosphotransferase